MIQFEDFSFRYKGGEAFALQGISMTIESGSFVGIIGNSGAGKSTLTYALSGIVPHHFDGDFYGSVKVNGLDTVEVKPEKLAQFVGEVFQDIDSQMVSSIVEDEILFGMENFGVPHDEIGRRLGDVLDMLGIRDLRGSNRIDFVGGLRGLEELKRRVDSGEMRMALALYPVTMQQIMDIADSGKIMPPKATWFEPKLRSGIVIHKLS